MTHSRDLVRWRKSSFSGQVGGDSCVEVAHTFGAVRDSKAPNVGTVSGDIRALVAWVAGGTRSPSR